MVQIKLSDSPEAIIPSAQSLKIACLGATYPPCILPLSELQPIYLSDMNLEKHHRGRFITLKTLSDPLQMRTTLIGGEDGTGDVCVVAVFHRRPAAEMLRKNILLAIKEPYLTLCTDGKVLIKVDHPSDLIRLDMDSRFLPASMTFIPIPLFSPVERQDMGDAAFTCGDLQGAANHYTRGLGIKQYNKEVRCTLHLSRGQVYFNLGHHELAVHDAVAAMANINHPGGTNDKRLKALLLAGRAAYELGDYIVTKEYFTRGLVLSPGADDVLAEIRRAEDRLTEERTGNFDFDAMLKSATKESDDHASFVVNTKIASAGHRGRGLFAAKRLAPGNLVLAEKAFYIVSENNSIEETPIVVDLSSPDPHYYQGRYAERIYGATEKILHNPTQAGRLLDLHDGGTFPKTANWVDSMVTVDTFRVEAITRLNAFAVPASSTRCVASDALGIWVHASHANHSCLPNVDRSFIGNMMVIRANREIGIGEEIFLSYCDQEDTYPQRRRHLSSYGFKCDCPLCVAEDTIPARILNKRAELIDESNNFITTNLASADLTKLTENIISAAEELLRQLEGTYPDEKYRFLPRLQCVPLAYWLCLVYGPPEGKITRALNALRNHGYFVQISNTGSVTVDRSTAVPLEPAIMITLIATAGCLQLGKTEAASELQKLRNEIYTILHGCDSGLKEMDRQFGI